jgi:hypothetical protein
VTHSTQNKTAAESLWNPLLAVNGYIGRTRSAVIFPKLPSVPNAAAVAQRTNPTARSNRLGSQRLPQTAVRIINRLSAVREHCSAVGK